MENIFLIFEKKKIKITWQTLAYKVWLGKWYSFTRTRSETFIHALARLMWKLLTKYKKKIIDNGGQFFSHEWISYCSLEIY